MILPYYAFCCSILNMLGWAIRTSFFSCPLLFFPSSVSLSYFILAVPTRVFGKTLLHEFLIFFNHAECYLLFRKIRWWKWSKSRLTKTNRNNDNNGLLSKLSYCCGSSGKEFSLYSYRKFIKHVCIFYKYYCKPYDIYFV